MRSAILAPLAAVLAGCAAMESVPPERLESLRSRAPACGEALPTVTRYNVDRFGRVQVAAAGPEAEAVERNFQDCVLSRGRWTQWKAGESAPMLDPPGPDNPEPSPALRVP